LNIATVNYHVGSKRELYERVRAHLRNQEQEFISHLLDDAVHNQQGETTELRALLIGIVDRMVEFWNQNPVALRFEMRHWLDRQEFARESERDETALELYKKMQEALQESEQDGKIKLHVDTGMFLHGLYTLIFGYFLLGTFDWETFRGDPHNPANLQRFKDFLLDYVCKMLSIC
jgi:AcrR family transcriptional regulator